MPSELRIRKMGTSCAKGHLVFLGLTLLTSKKGPDAPEDDFQLKLSLMLIFSLGGAQEMIRGQEVAPPALNFLHPSGLLLIVTLPLPHCNLSLLHAYLGSLSPCTAQAPLPLDPINKKSG